MTTEYHVIFQALVAVVLGGFLGWERETAGKWAGVRTHMLVSLGVVLFVTMAQFLVAENASGRARGDPVRAIQAIATVVAFIGAGTIIRDRTNSQARGLATAASVLVASGVGIAVSLDRYLVAVGSTVIALLVLRAVYWIERRFETGRGSNN